MDFLAKKLDGVGGNSGSTGGNHGNPGSSPNAVASGTGSTGSTGSTGGTGGGDGGLATAATITTNTKAHHPFRKKKGPSVVALHGKMSQEARDEALLHFRCGKKSILVATGPLLVVGKCGGIGNVNDDVSLSATLCVSQ